MSDDLPEPTRPQMTTKLPRSTSRLMSDLRRRGPSVVSKGCQSGAEEGQ